MDRGHQELHQWRPNPLIISSPSPSSQNLDLSSLELQLSHLLLSSPQPPPPLPSNIAAEFAAFNHHSATAANYPISDPWMIRQGPDSGFGSTLSGPFIRQNPVVTQQDLAQLRVLQAARAQPHNSNWSWTVGQGPVINPSSGSFSLLSANRRVSSRNYTNGSASSSNSFGTPNRVRDEIDFNLIQSLMSSLENCNNGDLDLHSRSSNNRMMTNNHQHQHQHQHNHNHNHHRMSNGRSSRLSNGHSSNSSSIIAILDMDLESWEELKGKVASYAKDQLWSRKLQATLPKLPREGIKLVISETKDNFKEIMYNQFGTHFFQALMDYCEDCDITEMLAVVMGSKEFLHICFDDHGTRALQKLVKKLDRNNADQRSIVSSVLRGVTLILSKDTAGHHVLEEFLKAFDGANDVVEPIMEEIVSHCLDIAMDRSGCCLLQKCVKYVQGETGQDLLRHIISYAFELSEHTFGNYVVQYILEMRNYHYTRDIMMKLKGKFAYLSKNKFGSHVVEKCLEICTDEQVSHIILEIVEDPDFVEILQDNFGNYVAQSALKRADKSLGLKPVLQMLESRIQSSYPFLHSHLHGKRVLSRIKHNNKYRV